MKMKLWACKEILKRYKASEKIEVAQDVIGEAIKVIGSKEAKWHQKKAARMIMDYALGKEETDTYIEGIAIVCDRNDRLVRKWTRDVVQRDKRCVYCGSKKNLHAHHVSQWADDPVNRINVNNGITLCRDCHSDEHPEMKNLIMSRGGL